MGLGVLSALESVPPRGMAYEHLSIAKSSGSRRVERIGELNLYEVIRLDLLDIARSGR